MYQSDASLSNDCVRLLYWNSACAQVFKSILFSAQVNHRHAERRALVAEASGALAPYVASEMRPSLILSILQQMSTDADAIVRRAVVHSLTHLLPLLPDLDKFQAVSICCFDNVDARPRLLIISTHLSGNNRSASVYASLKLCNLHAKLQDMEG